MANGKWKMANGKWQMVVSCFSIMNYFVCIGEYEGLNYGVADE